MPQENRRLFWAPASRQDLHSLWDYFNRAASPQIADKLLLDIVVAASKLRDRPFVGRLREEVSPGLRSIRVHPYAIFYRVFDSKIEIARVVHERRHISRTFGRSQDQEPKA